MRKFTYILLTMLILLLSGCGAIGDKSTNMSIIYLATTILSFILATGYFFFVRKKVLWFVFLFFSVFVVNLGYYILSVSQTFETALFANRLSYLGSVFLPMAMMMIILNVTKIKYKKWLPFLLSTISILVFLIAASYPYLDIYYKYADHQIINGVSVLIKTYGDWHSIYLVFLLTYFSAMVGISVNTMRTKKLASRTQTIVLAIAVFVNICVWFLEQLVDIGFEFLSVSYIISELFLISLHLTIADSDMDSTKPLPGLEKQSENKPSTAENDIDAENTLVIFAQSISRLTPTETKIYNYYVEGKTTKEIMELLTIKENTLKYHNKNIYSKLGVSSRRELLNCANLINQGNTD